MSKTKWYTKAVYIAVALAFVFGLGVMPATQVNAADGEVVNTLRVYGACNESAAFPYTTPEGPLSIQSAENPPKDFIVWNPAYMYHMDPYANDIYGTFFQSIVVNYNNANEKVFLRQWYVPKYAEPSGEVWTEQTPVESPAIVKEYTYMLLDTDNNPVAGNQGETSFVFPIADNSEQIGLDDYDVDGDGVAEIVNLNTVTDPNMSALSGDEWIDISTDMLTVEVGDVLSFLDHRTVITGVSTTGITADISYSGNAADASTKGFLIPIGETATAGRHPNALHVEALTNSPPLPPSQSTEFPATSYLTLVTEPWYLQVLASSATSAQVKVGRLLKMGESFFVDGAEYEIAAIYAPQPVSSIEHPPMKYITVRNGLPKYDNVILEALTIEKVAVQEDETLPLLPPFNMEHDMIDDVNIPEVVAEESDDNPVSHADEQYPDNVVDEEDLCDDPTIPTQTTGDPDGYGDESGLDMDYNTIAKRRVQDVPAIVETFIAEAKEERFDTNLLEEKFDVATEDWEWKNIETLPWEYTEFVLPELPDKPTETGYTTGDYILVSSFLAPNSATCGHPSVRVKFVYDAVDGTGLYVNSTEEEPHAPNAPTNPSPADDATDVAIPVTLSVTVTDPDGDAMDVTFYDASDDSVIGTDSGVASGGTASVSWSGLNPETEYSWYAKAYDGALWSAKSSTWSFTTIWDPMVYDEDDSGVIEIDELLDAIGDYIGGTITISQLLDVIDLYITG